MKAKNFLVPAIVAIAMVLTFSNCGGGGKNESNDSSSTSVPASLNKATPEERLKAVEKLYTPNIPTGNEQFERITDLSQFEQVLPRKVDNLVPRGTLGDLAYCTVVKNGKGGLVVDGFLTIPVIYDDLSMIEHVPDYVKIKKVGESGGKWGICSVVTGKETIPCEYDKIILNTKNGKFTGEVFALNGEDDGEMFYFNGVSTGAKTNKAKGAFYDNPAPDEIEVFEKDGKHGVRVKGERKPRIEAIYDQLIPVPGKEYYKIEPITTFSQNIHFLARIGDKWGLVHFTGAVVIPFNYVSEPSLMGDTRSVQFTGCYEWKRPDGGTDKLDLNGFPASNHAQELDQKGIDDIARKNIERYYRQ